MTKKLFYMVFTISLIFATKAFASDNLENEVKLSGVLSFQSGFANQNHLSSNEKHISPYNKNFAFTTTASINLLVAKHHDDIDYGLKLALITTAKLGTGPASNGSHIFIESAFGKIELGSQYDAADKMNIIANNVSAAAAGGWMQFTKFNISSHMQYEGVKPEFGGYGYFLGTELKYDDTNQIHTKAETSRKISYFTPKTNGLQFGISYIPDSSNTGSAGHSAISAGKQTIKLAGTGNCIEFDKNVTNAVTGGISYEHDISDSLNAKIAAIGEYGKATGKMVRKENDIIVAEAKLADVLSYNVGTIIKYENLSFGLSYGNLGRSLTTKEYHKTGRETHFYNTGIAYKYEKVNTSIVYFRSLQFKNILEYITVSSAYEIAPGLISDVSVAYFIANGRPAYYPEAPKKKTSGMAGTIGAKVKF